MNVAIEPHPTKTIRMPKRDLKRVLKALRDPDMQERQATGTLCDGEGSYCCLGVMQYVRSGGVAVDDFDPNDIGIKTTRATGDNMDNRSPRQFKRYTGQHLETILKNASFAGSLTSGWLDKVGWEFRDQNGNKVSTAEVFVPYDKTNKVGREYSPDWQSLIKCNDDLNLSFAQIADLIEAHAETY